MILHWRTKLTPLTLQWRGPNKVTTKAITSVSQVQSILAVIAGPPGPTGPQGPKGEKGDAAVYDETLPLVLDGGNF